MNSKIIALGAMALLMLGITGATVGGHLSSMKATQLYPSHRVSSPVGPAAPAAAKAGSPVGGPPAGPRAVASASAASATPAAIVGSAAGSRAAHAGGQAARLVGGTLAAGVAPGGDD